MDSKTAQETVTKAQDTSSLSLDGPLKCLSIRDIHTIDDALTAIGAYGEVRLVKSRGKLRFIQTVRSEDLARSA